MGAQCAYVQSCLKRREEWAALRKEGETAFSELVLGEAEGLVNDQVAKKGKLYLPSYLTVGPSERFKSDVERAATRIRGAAELFSGFEQRLGCCSRAHICGWYVGVCFFLVSFGVVCWGAFRGWAVGFLVVCAFAAILLSWAALFLLGAYSTRVSASAEGLVKKIREGGRD
jgi:hypothetical protein